MEIQGQNVHPQGNHAALSPVQMTNSQQEAVSQHNQELFNNSLSYFTTFIQTQQEKPKQIISQHDTKSAFFQNSIQRKNALKYIKALAESNHPYMYNANKVLQFPYQNQNRSNNEHSQKNQASLQKQDDNEDKIIMVQSTNLVQQVQNISQDPQEDKIINNSNKIQKKSGKFGNYEKQYEFQSPFEDNQVAILPKKAQKSQNKIQKSHEQNEKGKVDINQVKKDIMKEINIQILNQKEFKAIKPNKNEVQQSYFKHLQNKSSCDLKDVLSKYSQKISEKVLNQLFFQINKRKILPNLKQDFIKIDAQTFQMIEKQQLYEIDYNRVSFEKYQPLKTKLKQYLSIIQLILDKKITHKQFTQGISIQQEASLGPAELQYKYAVIVRNTFRRLEQYIQNTANKQIVGLSNEDLRIIVLISFSMNNYLDDHLIQQFLNAIKMAFAVPMKLQEAAFKELYVKLIRIVKEIRQEGNSLQQSNSIQYLIQKNNQEAYLCKLYLETKKFRSILEFVQKDYSFYFQGKQQKLKVLKMKIWLQKMVKKGLKKLQTQYRKYDTQKIKDICFNAHEHHLILKSAHFHKVRLAILEYYSSQQIYLKDMYDLMKMIEEGLTAKSSKIYPKKRAQQEATYQKGRITKKNRYLVDNESEPEQDQGYFSKRQSQAFNRKNKLNSLQRAQENKQLTLAESYLRTSLKPPPQRKPQIRYGNLSSLNQNPIGNFSKKYGPSQSSIVTNITNKIKLDLKSNSKRR